MRFHTFAFSVLLSSQNITKISGFRFSKEIDSDYSTTMTACGTYAYMAPEMMKRDRCSNKVSYFSP